MFFFYFSSIEFSFQSCAAAAVESCGPRHVVPVAQILPAQWLHSANLMAQCRHRGVRRYGWSRGCLSW